jgi:hypothetical protein
MNPFKDSFTWKKEYILENIWDVPFAAKRQARKYGM